MARVGDIVEIVGRNAGGRWVLTELLGAGGRWPPDARLMRSIGKGQTVMFKTPAVALAVVEQPTFAVGERVRVGARRGTVERADDAVVVVQLEACAKQGAGVENVPRWRLVLENRL